MAQKKTHVEVLHADWTGGAEDSAGGSLELVGVNMDLTTEEAAQLKAAFSLFVIAHIDVNARPNIRTGQELRTEQAAAEMAQLEDIDAQNMFVLRNN